MLRASGLVVLLGLSGFVGFVQCARGSVVPEEYVKFDVTADPLQDLSDSTFHYGYGVGTGAGGSLNPGSFPANQQTTNSAVIQIPNGVLNLIPTYTYFSLYSVSVGNEIQSYGIAVAINQSDYATAAGETFDELFGTNIDAAFNDGQTHTEQDLITELVNTGVADANFTAGITDTPAADIPYGQSGPLVLFSDGTNGGTIEVTATAVPEPAAAKALAAAGVMLIWRGRRRFVSSRG